ncbi:MAG: glycosyltransferase family 2 protein [Chitinispirillaceae bacterium]|nr:glycosyltransferase family 2 protein [Chitinispirillaceae bacterium]
MILFFTFLLWFSLAELLYSYTLYPLLLLLFVRLFGRPVQQDPRYTPTIGVLVPAHNEEEVIRKKIDNVLAIKYPSDKLTVWVGSDCSTDTTDALVTEYPDSRVHLWVAPQRSGKTGILNQLAPRIDSDIIMFTDANTMHHPDCLTAIVRNFADPTVGAVAGHIEHARSGDDESGESIYRSFESRQKYMEGLLHSTISAFGGFYAVRKEAFRPIPPNAYSNDDVLIPMNVIRQGLRVIYEPDAVSEEENTGSVVSEFSRRVRIGAGNFQAFAWLLDFLNPARGWPAFCLVSHKFTRWFSPFFLLAGFVSSGILFFKSGSDLYRMMFATGSFIVLAGMLYKVIPLRITRHVFYFLVMNVALIIGLYRFLRGIRSAAWSRTERST